MPILRKLGAAGWKPVTHATCPEEKILIERFGPKEGKAFFTVYNDSDKELAAQITIDLKALSPTATFEMTELVRACSLEAGRDVSLSIAAGDLRVISLRVK